VIGSGMMGHAIAEEFAVAGYEVIQRILSTAA
jgi:3-hydroxyacyl-CoA dehydrogenase